MCDTAVNPGVPELTVDTPEQDMREGRRVRWTCTSTGGNPPPSLTWYRNGSPRTSSGDSTVTPPAVKFGSTVASLSWTLTAADHLANFSCAANTGVISGARVYSPVRYYRVQCK